MGQKIMFIFGKVALAPEGIEKLKAKTASSRLLYNNELSIDQSLSIPSSKYHND